MMVTVSAIPPMVFGEPGSGADPRREAERIAEYDIVTVPDFAGARPDVFEVRTLFFLASWLASGNAGTGVRLHLACVGEPPESVRRLAGRAGAIVSVHERKTIRNVRCANKFRGFEVIPRTDHLLLIDTDVLFLGRMDELRLPPDAIAVAPAFKGRVKNRIWREAYAAAELEAPDERMWSQAREMGLWDIEDRKRRRRAHPRPMFPYYNAGVVFAPWTVPLGEVWQRHLERVNGHLEGVRGVSGSILRSDQTAFATCVRELQLQGTPLVRLPDPFHGHRLHLYRRKLRLEDIRLLHFTGSFSSRRWDADPRKWAGISARHFRDQLKEEFRRSDLRRRPFRGYFRSLRPALGDARKIGELLDRLYLEHVGPAQRGPVSS